MFHYPNGAVSIGTMVAPADNVVNEDVFAPDNDVLHSWWVPELGGKIDAIPGRTNHTWFKAPAGELRRPLLRPLRDPAHGDARHRPGHAARRLREVHRRARAKPASVALGKEEWEHVCAVCHRLDESYVGPSLGANPLLTDREGARAILRKRLRQDARSRQRLVGRPDRRARRLHKELVEGQHGASADTTTVAPYRADWSRAA